MNLDCKYTIKKQEPISSIHLDPVDFTTIHSLIHND